MDARPLRIDLFAFALGALAVLAAVFFEARNGAAVIMSGLCLAGLLAARLAGFSNRALVPLACGVFVILVMVWIASPAGPRQTSGLAHATGGVLVGWALSEYLRARLAWPRWGVVALAAVVALTISWEIGEWIGDALLTTSLDPNSADSALDILFGSAGGAAAVAFARLLPHRVAS